MPTTTRIVFLLLLLVPGCADRARPLGLSPEAGNPLSFLSISCEAAADGFPPGTTALILRVGNLGPGARRLGGVSITIDHRYRAALEDLTIPAGRFSTRRLERSSLEPGDDLRFVFSHDVSNHHKALDSQGRSMPRTLVPSTITIETLEGTGSWRVGSLRSTGEGP